MKPDDDVERLFSWLQTPDLRYREFAGAREITDAVVIYHGRSDTPEAQALSEGTLLPVSETVSEPYGFAAVERVEPSLREPPMREPPVRETVLRETVTRETVTREAAVREPAIIAPTPPPSPLVSESGPFALGAAGRSMAPLPPPASAPAASTLGGTHRETADNAQETTTPGDARPEQARPLDAVFGRLAGGNARPPDPRERLRHIPGLGPPAGRSR